MRNTKFLTVYFCLLGGVKYIREAETILETFETFHV